MFQMRNDFEDEHVQISNFKSFPIPEVQLAALIYFIMWEITLKFEDGKPNTQT